jgi:adenylate kinase family enzyme
VVVARVALSSAANSWNRVEGKMVRWHRGFGYQLLAGAPGPYAFAVRVNVRGSSGAGKSTFSRRLADRLHVPYVELDALYHGPDWGEPTAAEFRSRVEPIVASEAWVIDGNYEGKLGDLVLREADVVVWLDLPLRVKLRRLWQRTRFRTGHDVELWSGNRETWANALWGRESLFVWAVRTHVRHRRTFRGWVPPDRLVRLRSADEARVWLERRK